MGFASQMNDSISIKFKGLIRIVTKTYWNYFKEELKLTRRLVATKPEEPLMVIFKFNFLI